MAALLEPEKYRGMFIPVYDEYISCEEMVRVFAEVTGVKARCAPLLATAQMFSPSRQACARWLWYSCTVPGMLTIPACPLADCAEAADPAMTLRNLSVVGQCLQVPEAVEGRPGRSPASELRQRRVADVQLRRRVWVRRRASWQHAGPQDTESGSYALMPRQLSHAVFVACTGMEDAQVTGAGRPGELYLRDALPAVMHFSRVAVCLPTASTMT